MSTDNDSKKKFFRKVRFVEPHVNSVTVDCDKAQESVKDQQSFPDPILPAPSASKDVRMRVTAGVGKGTASGKVKKVLIRNSEQAVTSKNTVLVKSGEPPAAKCDVPAAHDVPKECKSKYAVPELYSTLSIAKEILLVSKRENTSIRKGTIGEAGHKGGSSSREKLDGKVANVLNFPAEEQIYRDLINLNMSSEPIPKPNTKPRSYKKLPKYDLPEPSAEYKKWSGKEYFVKVKPSVFKVEKWEDISQSCSSESAYSILRRLRTQTLFNNGFTDPDRMNNSKKKKVKPKDERTREVKVNWDDPDVWNMKNWGMHFSEDENAGSNTPGPSKHISAASSR